MKRMGKEGETVWERMGVTADMCFRAGKGTT